MYRALRSAPRLLRTSYLTSLRPMSSTQSIDKKVQEVPNPPSIDAKTKAEMECPAEENIENVDTEGQEGPEHGVNTKFAQMAEKIQKTQLKHELRSYSSTKGKADASKTSSRSKQNERMKATQ